MAKKHVKWDVRRTPAGTSVTRMEESTTETPATVRTVRRTSHLIIPDKES